MRQQSPGMRRDGGATWVEADPDHPDGAWSFADRVCRCRFFQLNAQVQSREHPGGRLEHIPGDGTRYVLSLSAASIASAALTLELVYRWGEQVPSWVPRLAGRRLPVGLVVGLAVTGAFVVVGIVALSIAHWSSVSGFSDRPGSPAAWFMVGCYAPATLWAPLLLATTWAYVRRRTGPLTPGRFGSG